MTSNMTSNGDKRAKKKVEKALNDSSDNDDHVHHPVANLEAKDLKNNF